MNEIKRKPTISEVIIKFREKLIYLLKKIESFPKREIFNECRNMLLKNQIRQFVIVEGLRRTGKTTLLLQLINEILKKTNKVENYDLIHLSLDSPLLSGYEVNDYIDYFHQNISWNKTVYIFLDEVQTLPEWSLFLKEIFDSFSNVKLMATSSSSLQLNLKETGGARWRKIKLNPLSFQEFINWKQAKGRHSIKEEPFQDLPTISELWKMRPTELQVIENKYFWLRKVLIEYIFKGSYPEIAFKDSSNEDYQTFVYEKIYRETIADILIFNSKLKKPDIQLNSKLAEFLFHRIIALNGKELSITKIGGKYGFHFLTIRKHLEILEKANLIIKSQQTSFTKRFFLNVPNKYYLIDHTFYPAHYGYSKIDELADIKGQIYENLVFNHLLKFSREKQIYFAKLKHGEIDFVFFHTPQRKYVIESKSQKIEESKIIKNLTQAPDSFNKICVNEDTLKVKNNILYIPITLFLLLEF